MRTGRAKILVVDDVPDNVRVLSYDLQDEGYDVVPTYSGQQAIQAVREEQPDLVLLDIVMPDMDGNEVCRRLKADPDLRAIPVIMMSARNMEEDIVAGLDAGAHDYVTKPFNVEIVMARVRSALRSKQDHDLILRMNQQLDQAFRAAESASSSKIDFLANLSRKLRDPLSGILALADHLATLPLQDGDRDIAYSIGDSGRALLALVDDLIDYTGLESASLTLENQPFAIWKVVEDIVESQVRQAAKTDISLIIDPQVPRTLIGDSRRLDKILFDLVTLSLEHTTESTRGIRELVLRVHILEERGEVLILRFEIDAPRGTPPSDLRAALHRELEGASLVEEPEGEALRLRILSELISLMGGQLSFEKSHLSEGFLVWFTVRTGRTKQTVPHSSVEIENRERVLCVDANSATLDGLQLYLRHHSYHVETSTRWSSAFKTLQDATATSHPFDALIVYEDIDGFDSRQLWDWMNEEEGTPSLRVLMMKSAGTPEDTSGPEFAVLTKPIRRQRLIDLLEHRVCGDETTEESTIIRPILDLEASPLRRRILILEPNDDYAEQARLRLESLDIDLDIVSDPKAALSALTRHHYDQVVLCSQEPILDRAEATRRLGGTLSSNQGVETIAVSASLFDNANRHTLDRWIEELEQTSRTPSLT